MKDILRYSKIVTLTALGISFLFYLGDYIFFFADSSLWNDEIYTIQKFSSRGLITSLSDYHVPNNHIFFNVLNTLIPKKNAFDPLQARMVSIVAIIITFLLTLVIGKRKIGFSLSLTVLVLLTLSAPLMKLIFQARGYGLIFVFTIINCYLIYQYVIKDTSRFLTVFVIINLLAVWTIPSYLMYTLSLLLAIFILTTNKKNTFYSGLVLGTLIILVHIPVLSQMLHNAKTYAKDWGCQFANGQAMFDVFTNYSFLNKDWQVLIFITALLIISLTIVKEANNKKVLIALILPPILSFSLYHIMETPLIRTSFFLTIPFIIAVVLLFRFIYLQQNKNKILLNMACIPLGLILSWGIVHRIKTFEKIPIENWKGVAETISQKFPKGTNVYCNFRKQQLEVYLDKDYPLVDHFDSASFNKGESIFVQSNFKQRDVPKGLKNFGFYIIPQKRGKMQEILFHDNNASPTFKIADSVQLNATCCGWTEAKFKFEKPSKVITVQYMIDNLNISATDFYFQVLLKSNESNDVFHASYGKDVFSKKHFITDVSQMSKTGNPNIQRINELILRVKIIKKNDFANLTIKNIVVN